MDLNGPRNAEDQPVAAASALEKSGTDSESELYYRPAYIVEPTAAHTHTVILLHGLGSNGRAFGSFFLTSPVISNDPDSPFSRPLNVVYPSMKWIFPTSSLRRITRFKRMKLSSWFNVFSVQDPRLKEELQIEGLVQSSQYLRDLIGHEVKVLSEIWGGDGAEKRIVFGGLSQGCAVSLATLLTLDRSLGGWVGMSGFMSMRTMFHEVLNPEVHASDNDVVFEDDGRGELALSAERSDVIISDISTQALGSFRQDILSLPILGESRAKRVLATPVFYGHGSDDPKVTCKLGDELVETIRQLGMNVTHKVYQALGHWIQTPEEINDMISTFTETGAWPDHVDGKNHLEGIARPLEGS